MPTSRPSNTAWWTTEDWARAYATLAAEMQTQIASLQAQVAELQSKVAPLRDTESVPPVSAEN